MLAFKSNYCRLPQAKVGRQASILKMGTVIIDKRVITGVSGTSQIHIDLYTVKTCKSRYKVMEWLNQ